MAPRGWQICPGGTRVAFRDYEDANIPEMGVLLGGRGKGWGGWRISPWLLVQTQHPAACHIRCPVL